VLAWDDAQLVEQLVGHLCDLRNVVDAILDKRAGVLEQVDLRQELEDRLLFDLGWRSRRTR